MKQLQFLLLFHYYIIIVTHKLPYSLPSLNDLLQKALVIKYYITYFVIRKSFKI